MGQAKAVVDRYWAAFESGDFDELHRLMSDDTELIEGGMRVIGADDIVSFLRAYRAAFPDLHHRVVSYVESGDTVALELRVGGTQTSPLNVGGMNIPATGKTLDVESCDYVTVANGRLKSWHTYLDQMVFLAQLGLLPAPATA
jgi:steroid delta-isomerase-like uncharacterized protein